MKISNISKDILKSKYYKMLVKSNSPKYGIWAIILIGTIIAYKKNKRERNRLKKFVKIIKNNNRGKVNLNFLKKCFELIHISFKSIKSIIFLEFILLNVSMVLRSFLSIYISSLNGLIVKSIININLKEFIKKAVHLGLISIPTSFINSYIEYLQKIISLKVRKNLTLHYHDNYIKDSIFYKTIVLDNRIDNPDQIIAEDIKKWAEALGIFYCDFSKPLLDLFLFSRKLSELMGYEGPLIMISWYIFYGILLKLVMPPFGKLIALGQQIEGIFRGFHSKLLIHSESIGFLRGFLFEKDKLNSIFNKLLKHYYNVANKKFYIEAFDCLLIKYGAFMIGYSVLGIPIFGKNSEEYLSRVASDPSIVMKDYVRNTSLLLGLGKAIGKVIVSYKGLQNLSGYTERIYSIQNVLNDLKDNVYERKIVNENLIEKISKSGNKIYLSSSKIINKNFIMFEDVPIIAPNGEVWINKLSFKIPEKVCFLIMGPNGIGKSSILRVLSEIWPNFGGIITKPKVNDILFISQRSYFPYGNLLDIVKYPNLEANISIMDLKKLLKRVKLEYLIEREKNLVKKNDWYDVLSGGEKQRICIARLLFHNPKFAVLDDSTSAVSFDIENDLYSTAKENGITLITITQRNSLEKFHNIKLIIQDNGEWSIENISN